MRSMARLALLLTVIMTITACAHDGKEDRTDQEAAHPAPSGPAKVITDPPDGADDVAPRDPVQITVTDGVIDSASLVNPEGEKVDGKLSDDQQTWKVTEPLGYGKTYTWSGTAVNQHGKQTRIEGSFTTVTPVGTVGVKSNVGDDQTYGIAMPIALTFDSPVQNKAAVEQALRVEATPETAGSWAWLENDTAVHWRPKEYWKPETQVHLAANIYGVHLGDGVYGANDLTVDFSIGRSQIVKANTQTHRMVVIRDGEQIAEYPASFGLDSDPGRVTRSGIHVVMSKHPTYFMNNPGYGYTDFEVQWAVRISNNGEFIHSAPWSVGDQGERNVSHGCINLAPGDAKEYFDNVLVGDPMEIEGSSEQLGPNDGHYYDWTYSWKEWTAMSALNQ